MFATKKRIARLVIILFAALSLVAGLTSAWLDRQLQPASHKDLVPIKEHIRKHGITEDLNHRLAGAPKHKNWVATVVVERQGEHFEPRSSRIVAANPPDHVGKTQAEFNDQFDRVSGRPGPSGWGETIESAPDGKSYMIWTMYIHDTTWIETWAMVTVAAGLVAWLGLTAWLLYDARERRASAIAGWVLLSLITGPVALAVWFISRPPLESEPEQEICRGCGADTPLNAAFCVRCGHALRPACPDCRRPVEVDWSYCSTCGTNLAGE